MQSDMSAVQALDVERIVSHWLRDSAFDPLAARPWRRLRDSKRSSACG